MTVRTKTSAILWMVILSILFAHQVTMGESPFVISDEIRQKMPKILIETLKRAEDDFIAVVEGKKPVHAKYVEGSYAHDGGSSVYKGDGYQITIRNRVAKTGDVVGKLYGPILKFEFQALRSFEVSNVRFLALLHQPESDKPSSPE